MNEHYFSRPILKDLLPNIIWSCLALGLLLGMLLGLSTNTQNFAGASFIGGWTSNETDDVTSVAFGDIDNDGDLDLAAANDNTFAPSGRIYRNLGNGNFTLLWETGDGDGDNKLSRDVAWGDMDNDGDLDLAFANSGQVNQVYRNDGESNFVLAWETTNELKDTRSVAWGDVDSDGNLDLVFGNWGDVNQVFLNQGNGSFVLGWESTNQSFQTSDVALGDMDGDGDLDLAIGNWDEVNLVYSNEGNGSFTQTWQSTGEENFTSSIAWGDLDGDNDLDLAVGNGVNEVNRIYENQSNGNFNLAWSQPTNQARDTQDIKLGDVDGDGRLDLVFGNFDQLNQVFLNDGNFEFSLDWESTGDSNRTRAIALGDVDGDGDLDIAVGNRNQITQIYINEGGSGLGLLWESSGDTKNTRTLAWGDVDGDGDLDLVIGNQDQVNQVYKNNGSGRFDLFWESLGDENDTRSIALGDMDNDGDLDLAVGNQNQVKQVYRNDGVGNFSLSWQSTGDIKNTFVVAWGDKDNDGDLDLAFGNAGDMNQVYENDGNGQFTLFWESLGDLSSTSGLAWGDMDNDGDLDLAFGNQNQVNQVYKNDGSGYFSIAWESTGATNNTRSVAWGDIDGDGDLDLAVANINQVNQVYRNEGNNNFSLLWESTGDQRYTRHVALGDVDGDGDLDLAFANHDSSDQVYLNNGFGNFSLGWETLGEIHNTWHAGWGDADSDGDLDLALGHRSTVNEVFQNYRPGERGLPDNMPSVWIARPGVTASADFYSTPEVLKQPTLPIQYQLSDPESDPVRFIRIYYSTNGGGDWQPATSIAGTPTTNLTTSPEGIWHTFNWDAQADLIKSDNLVLRIEAYQGFTGPGPYQSPFASAQTYPFRLEAAEWYAKVINEGNQPIDGAIIYYDGQLVADNTAPELTNQAGWLRLDNAVTGKPLVALYQVSERATIREAHEGWAYRTYITSLNLDNVGIPQTNTIGDPGEQTVKVSESSTLILFNIVISIEWDADSTYLEQLEEAFKNASAYLYDVTDGQMAFGQVSIYDNSQYWADADFQFSTKNTVRPYAFIGGLTSDDTAHSIRVGRFWNGHSGSEGGWQEPFGYKTLIHEFSHYALYLHDEYFVRTTDTNGHFTGQQNAACTGLSVINNNQETTNASIMYYQYNASEFPDDDRWNTNCQQTEQARINGMSDWQTILQYYDGPNWSLATPTSRGSVMAGPDSFPMYLLPFPILSKHDEGSGASPRQLTVLGINGQPFANALVALYTTSGGYTIAIDQGLTNQQGKLTIYGAGIDDTVQAASIDSAYAGAVTINNNVDYVLQLDATQPNNLSTLGITSSSPYLNLIPGSEGDNLFLEVHGASAGNTSLNAFVIPAEGGGTPQWSPLIYDASIGAYKGGVNFSAVGLGSGKVQVVGLAGGQAVSINSDYNLMRVINSEQNDLASEDGNLQLHVATNSLPFGADAYATIVPTGFVPSLLSGEKQLLGNAYEIRFSGAATELTQPGVLTMHYHPNVMGNATELTIYRWNSETKEWIELGGETDEQNNTVSVITRYFGIYALGGYIETENTLYLPLITK